MLMKLLGAFFRLVRWPNLVFIALTQVLFYYCFIFANERGVLFASERYLKPPLFFLLVLASVLIAAAGYIINDYFDLNIDKINKPDRIIIERIIKRRWAIVWHLVFTSAGVLLSFYIGYKIGNWLLGLLNLFSAVLLWIYSTTFKKKLLIGNVIISLLTAWVVLVLYFCELRFHYVFNENADQYRVYITRLFKLAVFYGGFAFIISLVREVVKDMEDLQGDEKYNCRTMPIVWGIPASKIFIATWLVVLIAAIFITQFYALQLHWWWSIVYSILFIILPLINIFQQLNHAIVTEHYHKLSGRIKMVMLTGILSMIFFKLYH
jgi:4-hydroxybenzoate polyprenyltransferase